MAISFRSLAASALLLLTVAGGLAGCETPAPVYREPAESLPPPYYGPPPAYYPPPPVFYEYYYDPFFFPHHFFFPGTVIVVPDGTIVEPRRRSLPGVVSPSPTMPEPAPVAPSPRRRMIR
jgi:hypothetical protein